MDFHLDADHHDDGTGTRGSSKGTETNVSEEVDGVDGGGVKQVKVVEEKILNCQERIKLYNSRETLFEQDLTDYEDFGRVVKLCEPYSALWSTASEWVTLFDVWMKGMFVDLHAEEVEQKVDK